MDFVTHYWMCTVRLGEYTSRWVVTNFLQMKGNIVYSNLNNIIKYWLDSNARIFLFSERNCRSRIKQNFPSLAKQNLFCDWNYFSWKLILLCCHYFIPRLGYKWDLCCVYYFFQFLSLTRRQEYIFSGRITIYFLENIDYICVLNQHRKWINVIVVWH